MLCLAGCASTSKNYTHAMQEDSITWEYDKESLGYPDTRNSNNNMLDSEDGSTYKGRGFSIRQSF